ncbi:MAG: FAD-binding oxidoreductase [Acidobacteria bacterium]|nr:FAD-binding oxidoreductase [Acidobacteriota bacterium]
MKTDILIVGSGFAGTATAYHLSRSYSGSILLVDKEEIPGSHASGRNASLILQSTEIAEIRHAVAVSRRFYAANEHLHFHPCGSLLLGTKDQLEKVRQPESVDSEYEQPSVIYDQISVLEGHVFEAALRTPSDGVIDISTLLQFYLAQAQERGVQVRVSCEVLSIKRNSAYLVQTSTGTIEANCVINAAGAWAPQIAEMAGASVLPLAPLKRHLFILGHVTEATSNWPFVWDLKQNFYFRPEVGDLLFSLCDEERTDRLIESVSPEISQSLAELIWHELPALRQAFQKRVWSCFRTKASDGRFVIGWDPRAENFFWVAGLAGHGVGASWHVGRLAAAKLLGRRDPEMDAFNPRRFEPIRMQSG